MKNRIFTLLFCLSVISVSLLFQSCEDVTNLTKFEVTQKLPTLSIPITKPAKSSMAEQFYEFSQYINIDSIKSANGLSSLEIENGKVTGALITITSPSGSNLGFLNSARLTLFTSTINELQVAHTGTIDPLANSVQFIIDMSDISAILSNKNFQGRFYYDVNPVLMPAEPVLLDLATTVKFTVAPL